MNSQLSGLARGSLKFRPSAVRSGPPYRDALLDVGLQIFPVRDGPARLTVYASGASSIEADPCCIEDGGGGLTGCPPSRGRSQDLMLARSAPQATLEARNLVVGNASVEPAA